MGLTPWDTRVPRNPINTSQYLIEFQPIKTDKDFSEFDIVIFLEKTFENVQRDKVVVPISLKCLKGQNRLLS